jgi:hypothetical protein
MTQDGTNGMNGVDGTNGVSVTWLGTFGAPPTSPSLNDAYYNSTDNSSYVWDGAAWQIISIDGA